MVLSSKFIQSSTLNSDLDIDTENSNEESINLDLTTPKSAKKRRRENLFSLVNEMDSEDSLANIKDLLNENERLRNENASLRKRLREYERRNDIVEVNSSEEQFIIKAAVVEINSLEEEFILPDTSSSSSNQQRMSLSQMSEEEESLKLARQLVDQDLQEITYKCIICLDFYVIQDIFIVSSCNHRFCFECIRGHCKSKLTDGIVKIPCPHEKCDNFLTFADIQVGLEFDKELIGKYDNFAYNEALQNMEDIVWCPRATCGKPCPREGEADMVKCLTCALEFCFHCNEEWHHGTTCEGYKQWKIDNGQVDEKFEEFMRNTPTKQCPHCKYITIKISGCNKMTCGKCHKYFCWLCGEKITGYEHFQQARCPQFTENVPTLPGLPVRADPYVYAPVQQRPVAKQGRGRGRGRKAR